MAIAEESEGTPSIHYLVVDNKVGPFQIVHGNESDGGIISDIVDEIFRGSGYNVQHLVLPVNRLTWQVAEKEYPNWVAFDAPVWNSFGDQGEYTEVPLFITHHVMLTCNPSIPNPVRSLDDLQGMSIAILRGFKYLKLSQAAEAGDIHPVPVDNFEAGLSLVSLGRTDGFVEMQSRLRFHLSGFTGDSRCMREVDISSIIPNYGVYLAMDKRLPERVKTLINDRLKQLENSGDVARIWRNYVPQAVPADIQLKTGY